MKIKEQVRNLLLKGVSNRNIVREVGCSSATVSYHREKLGLKKFTRSTYDWVAIREFYENGHTLKESITEFGFCKSAWAQAVERGEVVPKKIATEIYLVSDRLQTSRGHIKRRLLKEGLLHNHCYNPTCMFHNQINPIWNEQPLVMHLDHINGKPKDNRLENLRLLCPNCHRQTSTYAGRNTKKS